MQFQCTTKFILEIFWKVYLKFFWVYTTSEFCWLVILYKKKHIIQVELNSRIWKVESRSSLWNLRWRKWNSWVTLCTRKVLIKIYICTCFLLLKIVIFYTEILTGKVVLWCFFTSEMSEIIHNSTFLVKILV